MTVSLSGLDLSWMQDPANRLPEQMKTKRRPRPRGPRSDLPSPYFMPDVDSAYGGPWESIVDGSEISSRSNWREHNRRNGVEQVDRDYWGKTEDDHVTEIEERMGYDPSLIGHQDFTWKDRD